MSIGYHVVAKLSDGRVIATTQQQRRHVARSVLEICRPFKLLAFHLVDSHLHFELVESRPVAMQVARRIEYSLSRTLELPVPFNEAHAEPILSQTHLYRAFDYILRQQSRHGLAWDPYFEASNLSDLLGMRTTGRYTIDHVRGFLPRTSREQLLARLGMPSIEGADEPLELLRDATLAAAALPSLNRRTVETLDAVATAVHLCDRRLTAMQIGHLLGISRSTVFRARNRPANLQLMRAVRRQLFVRSRKADSPNPS